MNNKIYVSIGIIVVLLFAVVYIFLARSSETATEELPIQSQNNTKVKLVVDYSASFAIFTNGTFRIFTAPMYHNLSEDVFIQADNPNIVRVKKEDTTWNDFFKTLPLKLTKDCLTTGTGQVFCTGKNEKLRFYLNGELNLNVLDEIIHKGDRLLVSFGSENDKQIQSQLQKIPLIR